MRAVDGDNQMPFDLLVLDKKAETLAGCQCFNTEVRYGSGIEFYVANLFAPVKSAVDDLLEYMRAP